MNTTELLAFAGIDEGLLNNWLRRHPRLLAKGTAHPGRGTARTYSDQEIVRLTVAVRLNRLGLRAVVAVELAISGSQDRYLRVMVAMIRQDAEGELWLLKTERAETPVRHKTQNTPAAT